MLRTAHTEEELLEQWEALRRFRGVPAKSATKYFHENAEVLYVPTGQTYSNTTGIEALLQALRLSFHFVETPVRLSTHASVATSTVIEESLMTVRHNMQMDWLLPGVPESGETLHFPMCTVSTLVGNRIASQRVYWDQALLMKSAKALQPRGKGLIPRPENLAESMRTTVEKAQVATGSLEVASVTPGGGVERTSGRGSNPANDSYFSASADQGAFPTTGNGRTSTRVSNPPGGMSNIGMGGPEPIGRNSAITETVTTPKITAPPSVAEDPESPGFRRLSKFPTTGSGRSSTKVSNPPGGVSNWSLG